MDPGIVGYHVTQPNHLGVVVADLDAAMSRYTADYGVTWAAPQLRTTRMRFADHSAEISIRLAWSLEGPTHLELIEEQLGTLWTRQNGAPIHHIGHWTSDLSGAASNLEQHGHTLEVTREEPGVRFSRFAYFLSPDGFRLELMDAAIKPGYDAYLTSSAELPSASGKN